MAKKTAKFNKTDIPKLADEKPVVYRIQTDGGKDKRLLLDAYFTSNIKPIVEVLQTKLQPTG